ncbi:MAG: TonB-dependent receptor, partial [Ignavibacteriaceae bacterium]|nr:TonB-dependent receptor [Ignavibacteriaceae bacterium]
MKILIVLFFILNISTFAQQISILGFVFDKETGSPLSGANVLVVSKVGTGTYSDENGEFILAVELNDSDTLSASFIGYETSKISVDQLLKISGISSSNENVNYSFYLKRKVIPSQTILVEATIGTKGLTPLAFDQLKAKEIDKNYTVYDIPKYLSELPSSTFYSESGNGIGYNYISIRGFDQRRISVSVNGIPQNDPEDHNVYWLDFPDLLASTELIQVQRGAGSGVFGYPAIGGSINI